MKNNLAALRAADVNPHIVIQSLSETAADIKEMYVVALTAAGPVLYATGDLSKLSFAALCLHDLALKHLNGEIREEIGPDDGAAG